MPSTVLIVEDDKYIRQSLNTLLSSEGYNVELASNGQEALTLLEHATKLPSLIILDLMMPVMDGFQFKEQVSQVPKLAEIPVVIMTADGHTEEKRVKAGANEALKKPTDIDVILDTVGKYCTK